jgi:hypothetical protein
MKKRKYIENTTEKEKIKVIDDIIGKCRHNRDNDNCILFYIYDIDCYECPLFHIKKNYETNRIK